MDNYNDTYNFLKEIFNSKKDFNAFIQCLDYFKINKSKIYKYSSLENKNIHENLKNNIVYLSNPVNFNDPYDCNPRIPIDYLFEKNYINEIKNISNTKKEYMPKKLFEFIFDDKLPMSENEFIKKISNDKNFTELISLMKEKGVNNDVEIGYYLLKNKEIHKSISQIIYGNESSTETEDIIKKSIQKLVQYGNGKSEEEIRTKYNQINSSITSKDTPYSKFRKATTILSPKETQPLFTEFDEHIREVQDNIHNKFGECLGVSSFSESPSSNLMWAHYANNSKGICVEYDLSKISKLDFDAFLLPVNYSTTRFSLPLEKMMSFQNNQTAIKVNLEEIEFFPEIIMSLITKNTDWEYEKEWRLLAFVNDDKERKLYFPCISKIYAGVNISKSDLHLLNLIGEELNVEVIQNKLSTDNYQIEY